jgi:ABC-type multidrug transport system permease subunit
MNRISPVAYAFEALMANEFRTRVLRCSATDLVPSGPGYGDLAFQGCTLPGSVPGSDTVPGAVFVSLVAIPSTFQLDLNVPPYQMDIKYGFSAGNIWRNVGILWAM